jgi:hypothetical protein
MNNDAKPKCAAFGPQKLKLKNFTTIGLAKTPDFTTQQNGLFVEAFIESKPEIRKFLDQNRETNYSHRWNRHMTPECWLQMRNLVLSGLKQNTEQRSTGLK